MDTYREGLRRFPEDKALLDGLKAAEEVRRFYCLFTAVSWLGAADAWAPALRYALESIAVHP